MLDLSIIATGAGRGMGLMFVLSGLILLAGTLIAWSNPRIRHVEEELPDAVNNAPGPAPVPAD